MSVFRYFVIQSRIGFSSIFIVLAGMLLSMHTNSNVVMYISLGIFVAGIATLILLVVFGVNIQFYEIKLLAYIPEKIAIQDRPNRLTVLQRLADDCLKNKIEEEGKITLEGTKLAVKFKPNLEQVWVTIHGEIKKNSKDMSELSVPKKPSVYKLCQKIFRFDDSRITAILTY